MWVALLGWHVAHAVAQDQEYAKIEGTSGGGLCCWLTCGVCRCAIWVAWHVAHAVAQCG